MSIYLKVADARGGDAELIRTFNAKWPDAFLELEPRHLRLGYWWIAWFGEMPVGFCGMVPFTPFPFTGYLKRAGVIDSFRGQGLHMDMIAERENKARSIGWHRMVSECEAANVASANSHIDAGYRLFTPERPWATTPSLYWVKDL